ncbi:MAG: enoyl-CoA hydratase/isomerase family protein [Acidimicrobiia bacterium]|nr:enoyl-CoA hydratase/isomerase family protein [Acidimicrobiia bacterium]
MMRFEIIDRVAVLTLDRQERRNALNAEICDEIRAHFTSVAGVGGERVNGVGAIVIAAEGSAFCAGADLVLRAADVSDGGGIQPGGNDSFRPAFERLLYCIVEHPLPVFAAINGPCMGAGMQLAVGCDFRVASPKAIFSIPASKLGIVLSAANISRLSRLVGPSMSRDLLLASRSLNVDEAERAGLVNRRADDVRDFTIAWADEVARLAPITVHGHKRALHLIETGLSQDGIAELKALEETAFMSSDLQEGLEAFAQKRPPEFTGK